MMGLREFKCKSYQHFNRHVVGFYKTLDKRRLLL